MNSPVERRISAKCRVCSNISDLVCDIFSTTYKQITLAEMMMSCSAVSAQENDGLSPALCLECKRKLIAAYNFCELCAESDRRERELLENKHMASLSASKGTATDYEMLEDSKSNILTSADHFDQSKCNQEDLSEAYRAKINAALERIATTETMFDCFICKQDFSEFPSWKHHLREHSMPLVERFHSFEAIFINVLRFSNPMLLLHLRRYYQPTNRPQRIPTQCQSPETNEARTAQEGKKNYVGPKRSFECYICKKKDSRLFNLQRHIKSHTGRFSCDICLKRFNRLTKLEAHLLVHG